jgi:hypothetical protein
MRAVNKKLKKTLPGFDLDELMRFVVYNNYDWYKYKNYQNRPTREPFEDWFDNKERLNKNFICDCDNRFCNTTIDWIRFGNPSNFRSYKDFQDLNTDLRNFEIDFPFIFDDQENLLGTYQRMSSPGIITLNMNNIQIFFWSIICTLSCQKGYAFTREKIEDLARLCILKTLYHELFHHVIDVQKNFLANYSYNYYIDEALAVACSRHLVGFEAQFNLPYVSDFLDLAYSYNQPGYRDWINYKSDEQFLLELSRYTRIDNRLIQLGQEVTPIAEGILYSIFENPNVQVVVNL